MLTIDNVSLKGINRPRLSNVGLSLDSGKLIGLIGPNGAGKSSLLKAIAGVEAASGKLLWNRQSLSGMNDNERANTLSYMAQDDTPQWDLTIEEIIDIGLLKKRLPRSERQRRIEKTSETLNLSEFTGHSIQRLSRGELQRVLLARALVSEPELLLCDEPANALDIYHQLNVLQLLKKQSEKGRLVMMAIHDIPQAAEYCDELVLLDKGRLVCHGQPFEVLTKENLAATFGIHANWICNKRGVAWQPRPL
ncbi:ABC transporter ATP-binding protein [Idiomarina sp. 29L]|uniref:ABC transporter ATP-binding protein n=1 Tax=Idiomarina sp. 29L TaxID=2508877 RepID=UPI001012E407|nr:ABC transporter ATP-binding protein [Idiomarina sp. 29L]RXS42137.1 ABC transporter ATP-binding protein [Idiomarina sp. 29L]